MESILAGASDAHTASAPAIYCEAVEPARRLRQWATEGAIENAMARVAGRPMAWGRDDCCLWVADIVAEMTGRDPAAAFRGYATSTGALRRLGIGGLAAALAAVAAREAWPEIDPEMAVTGDIGLVGNMMSDFGGAAVIRYEGWWVGREDFGVGFLPTAAVTRAWCLPCRR